MEIITRGAEAVLFRDGNVLVKKRLSKSYRLKQLDELLRKKRTKSEARILEKAATLINVPKILRVKENEIDMQFVNGKVLSSYLDLCGKHEIKEICEEIGKEVAALHKANIIHGDLTTSNMIWKENKKNKLYFVDFGLAFHSTRVEDKAVDFHLLQEAFKSKHFKIEEMALKIIRDTYKENYIDANKVLKQLEKVESRGRYKKKREKMKIVWQV